MTSYHLSPGYSNHGKCKLSQIVAVARSISKHKLRGTFRAKCLEYGVPESVVDDYIAGYVVIPSADSTITIRGEDLMQLASGGGSSRDIKENVRKAFGILVLDECYKRGLSVSFVIA